MEEEERIVRHTEGTSKNDPEKEMSFLDHLEEFRWHLIRGLIAVSLLTIVAFLNKYYVFDVIILGPSKLNFWSYRELCSISNRLNFGDNLCIKSLGFSLTNIQMSGQFVEHLFVSFMTGLILGFPYLCYELWRFVKPALTRGEKWYARSMVFFSSLLFFVGILFGYFVLSPISINFLGSYRVSKTIENSITLSSYISTVSSVTFGTALVFELPMVVFFLTKMGLVTPSDMRKYRKHALIVILFVSAILTPPDVTSQILLGIPFFLLYELSIIVSVIANRQNRKKAI